MTITAPAPATHVPANAAPPLETAAQASSAIRPVAARSSAGPAAPVSAQETAGLNQLLSKYKYDISHGAAASTLSGLSRQIMAAAKAAGQRVALPRAPASAGAVPAATTAESGKVNVMA